MKYTVSKKFPFEAAHSLPHLPKGHKCRRPHGHSYVIEIFCSGHPDARGFVVDYAEISNAVDPVIAKLDHQDLNSILLKPTTAENLAAWFLEQLEGSEIFRLVTQINVYETASTCVSLEK